MISESLDSLEGIYHDLEALRDNQFQVIERLSFELETHIKEFQTLLQHKRKNDCSRSKIIQGTEPGKSVKVEIDHVVYEINEDFRNQTIQLADELDLDELESARLLLQAQDDARAFDRSLIVSAIMRFHRSRHFLLECFRTAFHMAISEDVSCSDQTEDEETMDQANNSFLVRAIMDQFITNVFDPNRDAIWANLTAGLHTIETGLHRLADRTQRASVIGQNLSRDEAQIMDYERVTLYTQHESLTAIIAYALKSERVSAHNFQHTLGRIKTLDKHDVVMVHYVLMVLTFCAACGPPSNSYSDDDAAFLYRSIVNSADTDKWAMRNLCRLVRCSWIVHYKERSLDQTDDAEKSAVLAESLKDGGLQFMLSIAQDVNRNDWADSSRVQLTNLLIKDVPTLPSDSPACAPYFQQLLMDSIQSFTHAFISNMPDTLRLLRVEEDDQRKLLRSRFQSNPQEYRYDLDRFLVLIAYAFQHDPENAKTFWIDTDGSLYGFLQWSAKRLTTPRVAAFCEMLRSLSVGHVCADYAHRFLLDEGSPVAGKLRRSASLSWAQIFAELEYFATRIKARQAVSTAAHAMTDQHSQDQVVEPESIIMVESYLRLIAHLAQGSSSVRHFLINNETQPLSHVLFQLVTTSSDTRIRAWCFTTLASLLTDRQLEIADSMWEKLDHWIAGYLQAPLARNPIVPGVPAKSGFLIFEMIAAGSDEAEGFMRLLNQLILPSLNATGLNDMLPFPDNLGMPYRLPGIELYVDFALGKIFAARTNQLSDTYQLNLLRLSCLDFIRTGLASFNENLVILANRSGRSVDLVMRASSLETYVLLHPFCRMMEWLAEDRCLDALFAVVIQDVDAVNMASPDSPFLIALIRAIEVMNLIMLLQSTYLDVVKPFVKRKAVDRKPVTQSPVPCFEDAVLKRLDLVVSLGLYCGVGHSELTLQSLKLLESLSSSKKLSHGYSEWSRGSRGERSRLIIALEKDDEAERVSRALTNAMAIDVREYEAGPLASGYNIKAGILSFLLNTLSAGSRRPTIAHLLLGFGCKLEQLVVEDQDAFADGACLFYAIGRLAIEYPDFEGDSYISWASHIKRACIEILEQLWQSPLSGRLVAAQLRESDFLFLLATRQRVVSSSTLFDGLTTRDVDFMLNDSASTFRNFLGQRTALFDCFARELRFAKAANVNSLLQRLQSCLLGSTLEPGVAASSNANVFDLSDFMELEIASPQPIYTGKWFNEGLFEVCRSCNETLMPLYDIKRAKEIVMLQRNEFMNSRLVNQTGREVARTDDHEAQRFEQEANDALLSLIGHNNWREVSRAHEQTLVAWVRLVAVAIESCDFQGRIWTTFIQQAYQLTTAKFEKEVQTGTNTALELAWLILILLNASSAKIGQQNQTTAASLDASASTPGESSESRLNDGVNDVESRVFRTALNAASSCTTTPELREICYQICSRYLRDSDVEMGKKSLKGRNIQRAIKTVNERLVEIACDDAYASRNTCGIAALLLLEALVIATADDDDAKLVLESLERLNFVPVLVDGIKSIADNLRRASHTGERGAGLEFERLLIRSEIWLVIGYHQACLALLLRIAQTRRGATQVLGAGIFQAAKDSTIFSTDPDMGFEMNSNSDDGLKNFFLAILGVLRVINAIVINHQGDQTLSAARGFLQDHRASVVGILKRHAKAGGIEIKDKIDLSDLVDNLTLLISATDFLVVSDAEMQFSFTFSSLLPVCVSEKTQAKTKLAGSS